MNKNQRALLEFYAETVDNCFMEKNPINRLKEKINMDDKDMQADDGQTNDKQLDDLVQDEFTRKISDNCNSLDELREVVENYKGIEITKYATNVVFGDGNPDSDIMLIGEAPGANEDKYGIPFCGQSGKLLDNILKSINIDRTNCYITNTIFWRPPANRRPTTDEIKTCKPFVEKHIALVNPKTIVLVGSTAVESLLGLKTPMGSLRTQMFNYTNKYLTHDISTFVIFHPSYLLRQPSQKKTMWCDMQKIYKYLYKN